MVEAVDRKRWQGIAASPGLAVGPAVVWNRGGVEVTARDLATDQVEAERERFRSVVAQAKQEITDIRRRTAEQVGEAEAKVFDAHLAFLDDPAYVGEIEKRIDSTRKNAEFVCQQVTDETAAMLASIPDDYLRARADDIRDVGHRLVRILSGVSGESRQIPAGAIVVAEELAPSDTAGLPTDIGGFVLARGSKTAHTAILARTMGIPSVVGLGHEALAAIADGDTLIVDGDEGTVVVRREAAKEAAKQPGQTADGRRIEVFANIGSLQDVAVALANGAEGVGLFRTEFLYQTSDHWPTEEEQFEAYRQVLQAFQPHPVIIRTLDIGGDKPLPFADMPKEDNPFLGHRAIRFSLAEESVFRTQLRALLRASRYGQLWIMFPMIQSLDELRRAKALLADCRAELVREGVEVADTVKVGMMVEIPAAAVMADLFAPEVDFMSIGTNDLTQYTLAVDRGNERVAPLYQPTHPAVLRLVRMTCEAGRKAGIPVGMCGELAGDADATELLVGLGLTELSMSAGSIPAVKQRLRQIDSAKAEQRAQSALTSVDSSSHGN
jgi:phosphotransferase system enzyme I (PtsI)